MIICPECRHQELEGTLFCGNCGASLIMEDDEGKTTTMPFIEFVDQSSPPLVGKSTTAVEKANQVRFIVPSSGRKITLPMQDKITIGREDPRRDINPDVDLTEDGGSDAGISRLHASIVTTAQGIAIMDLNSVNGTWVNNYRIPPRLPFALSSGDELKLGELVLHVFFEE